LREAPAAFRRLCVETLYKANGKSARFQPPSGGCVLKQAWTEFYKLSCLQPPSGGCVLKLPKLILRLHGGFQPPSGGCVLKQVI